MKLILNTLAAATLMTIVGSGSALAQAPPSPTETQVNVWFSTPLTPEERDGVKNAALHLQHRIALYQLAGRECATLLQTVALECRAATINITITRDLGAGLAMHAHAIYRVTLK